MNNAVDPRSVASTGFARRWVAVVGLFLLILVTVAGAAGAPQAELPAWQAPRILKNINLQTCLLYTSPSPRDRTRSRMPSSA